MPDRSPRLAVRALIVEAGRVCLVNAYPGDRSDLLCCPGGGVERHRSLEDNLRREVHEELGCEIAVGRLRGVSEFHHPANDFHQVELFYDARILTRPPGSWSDPEGIVNRVVWATRAEIASLRVKPDFVPRLAFAPEAGVLHDPLERAVD